MRRLTTKQGCLISCLECEERVDCEKYCEKINPAVKKLKEYENIGIIPNQVKELLERDTAQKPTKCSSIKISMGIFTKSLENPRCVGME